MQLNGLHHVTAVTAQAQANVAFYTQVLGMRLVKKTVNQDDVSAYHLFYGDELGQAGTELTFFDWAQMAPNRNGPGSISGTALRVGGEEALRWWVQRFDHLGVPHSGLTEFHGHRVLRFTDPEGQALALMDDDGAPGGAPWIKSPVPVAYGVRGLYASTLTVQELQWTAHVLTQVMGYEQTASYESGRGECTAVFELDGGGPGNEIYVIEQPAGRPGRLGAGGVHHIAFRVPDADAQVAWRQRLAAAGLGVTEVIDRFYFKSIYFRIPGGILFEIATDGPGFATDEDAAHLGERLSLPPFLEPHRRRIEAGLRPLD
jgi:glyoxalase family protein